MMADTAEKTEPVHVGFADDNAEKRSIIKNLLIISCAFLLLFTAFQSLSNLQSSLNITDGLGLASLSVIYAALIISCMFVPPLLIDKIGCKWAMTACMACYTTYTMANFAPVWYTLIPASILLGFAAAPLWSAKCSYLTTTGIRYAKMTNQSEDAVVTRFFGIFFMIFQSGQIWGNLISSLILKQSGNITAPTNLHLCGANDCQLALPISNATGSLNNPSRVTVNTLMGIYLAVGILAVLLIATLLDKVVILGSEKREKGACSLFVATLKHLKDRRMQLLIPLTVYSGLEQGFVFSDFTKSYVTCTLGIDQLGFVMICFGVTDAIFSFALGKLSQYTGRPALIFGGAIINIALIITLLVWKPNPDQLAVFYIAAAGWGFADAIWQTQVNAFYGHLFPTNQEAAFSNYRLWESLGFVVAYAYSKFFCVAVKLYILIGVLVVGVSLYGVIEIMQRRSAEEYSVSMEELEKREN